MNKRERLDLALMLVNLEFGKAISNIESPNDIEVENGEAWNYVLEILQNIKEKYSCQHTLGENK